MSTGSPNPGIIETIEEKLSSGAEILRSFWKKFTSNTAPPLPSGVNSQVRETDLTKFLSLMETQVSEEQLTLQGTWINRKGVIESKLLEKDFDGAEPLMIVLSSDIKAAIGNRNEWAKVANSFAETKIAVDELFSKWKAPESLGTKGLKGRIDAIDTLVLEQDYVGALSNFDELTKAPLSAQELLVLYPDRQLWDDLSDTLEQAQKNCEALLGFSAPEYDSLTLELEGLNKKASPEVMDYKSAAAELPGLAKRIEELHGLYPARRAWALIAAQDLVRAKRWLQDLNGWKTPEYEEFSKELDTISKQGTDASKQYDAAVLAFPTLYGNVDLAHQYWSKLRAIETQFNQVMQQQPDNAGALRSSMAMATELGENKKYVEAKNVLERIKGLLKVALLSNTDLSYLAAHVATLRIAGETGLQAIESKLRLEKHKDAERVADILKDMVVGLPTTLEEKLRELDSAEESAVAGLKTEVKTASQEWLNYLATHKKSLDACTANPYKVAFHLAGPITETVKTVLNQVA